MKIYDKLIRNLLDNIYSWQEKNPAAIKRIPYDSMDVSAKNSDDFQMILKKDMSYELGGGSLPAVGLTTFTTDNALCKKDEIILIGEDLNNIDSDRAYGKITIVNFDDEKIENDDDLYKVLKKIDYMKYKCNPLGYMTRISTANSKEPVRISKAAIKNGINFQGVGNAYIKKYHEIKEVKSVILIFITDRNFDYDELIRLSEKNNQITESLNKIFDNLSMDCGTCNYKNICDEVEDMRKLHFNRVNI